MTVGSTPCFEVSLTVVSHPWRQAVGHGWKTVVVGVLGQDGFGPGMVVGFTRIHSGTMQAVLRGGQPGTGNEYVAV